LPWSREAIFWRLQQEGVNDANKAKSMLKKIGKTTMK